MVTLITGFSVFTIWSAIALSSGPCFRAIWKPHDWVDRALGMAGVIALLLSAVMGVLAVNKTLDEPQNIVREP